MNNFEFLLLFCMAPGFVYSMQATQIRQVNIHWDNNEGYGWKTRSEVSFYALFLAHGSPCSPETMTNTEELGNAYNAFSGCNGAGSVSLYFLHTELSPWRCWQLPKALEVGTERGKYVAAPVTARWPGIKMGNGVSSSAKRLTHWAKLVHWSRLKKLRCYWYSHLNLGDG